MPIDFTRPAPSGVGPSIPEGQPSIYSPPEEWAAYRAAQAAKTNMANNATAGVSPSMDLSVLSDSATQSLYAMLTDPSFTGGGAGRGSINPADAINTQVTGAGAGRGMANPANAVPPVDPTQQLLTNAFPEIFRQTPPQGVVNTTKGVERVNARTGEHGVTAIRDAKGNVTLTNLGADGKPVQGTGSPNSIGGNGMGNSTSSLGGVGAPVQQGNIDTAPNTPLGIKNAVTQLGTTTDYATARVLMSNLEASIAEQKTQLTSEAIKFAEAKFGVPGLNKQLQEAEQADHADPQWYPGIGDSPMTAKIRASIQAATNDVTVAANRFLATNSSYAALEASHGTAKQEMQRIANMDLRKSNQEDAAALSLASKTEQRDAIAVEIAGTMTPDAQDRVKLLNPQIQSQSGDQQAASMGRMYRGAAPGTDLYKALNAPEHQLAALALGDNTFATKLVQLSEQRNGLTEADVNQKLLEVKSLVNKPTFMQDAINSKYAGQTSDASMKAKKEELAALNTGKLSFKGEEKAAHAASMYQLALDMKRREAAIAPIGDIRLLIKGDSPLNGAIAESIRVTKDASVGNVLHSYIGATSGPERMAKIVEFSAIVMNAGNAQKNSIFGTASGAALSAAILEATRPKAPLGTVPYAAMPGAFIMNTVGTAMFDPINNAIRN